MQPHAFAQRAGVLALLALTVLALFARVAGVRAGLPHLPEPDNAYFLQPSLIADGSATARASDDYTKYPHLVSRILMQLPESAPAGPDSKDRLEQASLESLRPRILMALAGAACVPAVFVLAREFLSTGWSLFAAALLATSLLHALFSIQGRPHVLVSLFITLTIWASLRLLRRGGWADYLLAGACAALALGSLHNGVAALLPLCAAHFLRARGLAFSAHFKLALPLLLVAASAVAFLPFMFVASTAEPSGLGLADSALRLGCHQFHLDKLHGRGFLVIGWTLWSYEPLLACLLALALPPLVLRAVRWRSFAAEERRAVLVVASFVLPYLAMIGIYDASYERFVIPLLSCFALIAAWGLSRAFARVASGDSRTSLRVAIVLALLFWPCFASIRLTRLLAAPDTATLAARWISANGDFRAEHILMTPRLDLPLPRDPSIPAPFSAEELRVGAWVYPWTYYQIANAVKTEPAWRMEWLPTLDADFLEGLRRDPVGALASLDWTLIAEGSFSDGAVIPGNLQRIHDALGAASERIASFVPYEEDGSPRSLWWQETSSIERPFWSRLIAAKSFGPAIEIYRRR